MVSYNQMKKYIFLNQMDPRKLISVDQFVKPLSLDHLLLLEDNNAGNKLGSFVIVNKRC